MKRIDDIEKRMKKIDVVYSILHDSVEEYCANDGTPNKNASQTAIESQIKILRHELTALKEEMKVW